MVSYKVLNTDSEAHTPEQLRSNRTFMELKSKFNDEARAKLVF